MSDIAKVFIVSVIAAFVLIMIIESAHDDKQKLNCTEAVVLEKIHHQVQTDSLTAKNVTSYKIDCKDSDLTMRVRSDREFPIGSTIKKEWIYHKP